MKIEDVKQGMMVIPSTFEKSPGLFWDHRQIGKRCKVLEIEADRIMVAFPDGSFSGFEDPYGYFPPEALSSC